MTKAIKKGLLAILLFGFVVASVFSVLSFRNAFADDLTEEDKTTFAENVQVIVGLADADDDEVLTAAEVREIMGTNADRNFYQLYNIASNKGVKGIDSDIVAAYDVIYAAYNANHAVDLYSGITSYCKFVIDKAVGYSYTACHAQVEEYRELYNTIREAGDKDFAFLHTLLYTQDWTTEIVQVEIEEQQVQDVELEVPVNLVNAEKQIAIWYESIAEAINAINAIKVRIATEVEQEPIGDGGSNPVSADEPEILYEMVTLTQAEENELDFEYVLGSTESIAAARAKYNAVSADDRPSVENYAKLTDAEAGLKEQVDKIDKVVEEINKLYTEEYSKEAGKEVCWSIKDKIETAKANFDALDATEYNDLKKAAKDTVLENDENTIGAKLQEMLDNLDTVSGKINAVNVKINEIGTVLYTTASLAKIKAAEDAFAALPNDVKTHDVAEAAAEAAAESDSAAEGTETAPATYYVEKYTVMTAARAKFTALQAQVDAVIDAVTALPAVELSSELFTKYNVVVGLINAISADANNKDYQLDGDGADLKGVWASALNTEDEEVLARFTTVKAAYDYFTALVNRINTTARPIRDKIVALSAVELTNVFDTNLTTITTMLIQAGIIDADAETIDGTTEVKDERYISAIGTATYSEYVTKRDIYLKLNAIVEAWADKVAEIGTVSVNTFDKVEAAKEAFTAIINNNLSDDANLLKQYDATTLDTDLSAFEKVYNEITVKAYNTTYKAAVDKKAEIITKLNAVKAAADALVRPGLVGVDTILEYDEEAEEDIERKVNEEDYAKYATDVSAVTALVNGLATYDDTTVEGYITTAKYFETYAGTEDDTAEDYVYSFTKYEKALVYVKADAVELAINKITANATENVNYIAQARTAYDAENEAVQKEVRNFTDILKAEEVKLNDWKDKVNALLKEAAFDGSDVAANKVGAISDITTDEQLKAGIYKLNVVKTKELIDAYADFTAVEKAYTDVALTKDLADRLYAIAGGANAEEQGTKLTYIDKELSKYVIAYNNGSPAAERYDQLVEILDNLDVTQKALLTNASDFEQIARDNEMALELAKAIVNLYADVQVQVDAKTVVEYNIISSIYKNLNGSQKVLVDANVATLNSEASLDKIGETIGNGGAPANIDDAIAKAIADAKTELTNAIAAAKAEAIADAAAKDDVLKTAYEAADTALEAAIKTAYEAADAALKTAYEEAIADAKTELASAIAAAKAEAIADAAAKDTALQSAITTAYEAAITAAKAELTETYNAEIDSLRRDIAAINAAIGNHTADANKIVDELNAKLATAQSTATAALIVAIVGVLAAGAAIVIIFVLRKRG